MIEDEEWIRNAEPRTRLPVQESCLPWSYHIDATVISSMKTKVRRALEARVVYVDALCLNGSHL